ncbi:MAG: class I SAM-dependent RNA methyltransferase [Eubacterium sp.]|nr:class I SAM-dependent RNA methyltransferase [Eubacterium sp.]
MYELIATATFGLEAVVRREIEQLGYKVTRTEDGKVAFLGDVRAIVRANLWLRAADRVLIKMAEFQAAESEELFQQVKGIAWEELIPPDGKFTVNCSTVRSRLRSEPNNQKTVKKAIVERLSSEYGIDRFPETGAEYTVKVTLLKDRATITVDTTGESLHKRGYRVVPIAAPLKETLAAAMIELSFWHADRVLIDPCCGSGTIPIEAALIGRKIAPGLKRTFASERWDLIPDEIWREEREHARSEMKPDLMMDITACDIDPKAVDAAKKNARAAGVADTIRFRTADISKTLAAEDGSKPKHVMPVHIVGADGTVRGSIASASASGPDDDRLPDHGIIITNPVYGERIGDQKQADHVFAAIRGFMAARPDWSVFIITPDKKTEEKAAGRRADRRRKLYNGNIEVCYYQFHGQKSTASGSEDPLKEAMQSEGH